MVSSLKPFCHSVDIPRRCLDAIKFDGKSQNFAARRQMSFPGSFSNCRLHTCSGTALNNDLWFRNGSKEHPVLFMVAPQTSVWAYISSFGFMSTSTL